MRENTKKTIYLGAAAFVSSVLASLIFSFGIPFLPTVLLCVTAGSFAATSLVAPSKLYLLIIPASITCSFLITFSALMTAASAAPFAAGILIGIYAKGGKSKTGAVIMGDIAYGAIFAVGLALAYFIANKTLALSAIASTVNEFFDNIGNYLKNALENLNFYEMYSRIYEITVDKEEFISGIVKEVIFVSKAISPGIIISALNIISYVSVSFYILACKVSKTDIAIPNGKWVIFPKAASAWMAIASVLVFMALSFFSTSDFFTAVQIGALNMTIILVPPFFVCGINGLRGRMRSVRFKFQAIVMIVIAAGMLIISFPMGPGYSAVFISLVGAWDIITFYRLNKQSKNNEEESN